MKKTSTTEVKDEADSRLARLVRDGVVRPSRRGPDPTLFTRPPPRLKAGVSVVAAVIAERREGR